jgi:hypothetical protein
LGVPLLGLRGLFVVAMYALGVACLTFQRAIQSAAVKAVATGMTACSEHLSSFIRSKEYLTTVRAVGALALLAAAFLTFATLRSGG